MELKRRMSASWLALIAKENSETINLLKITFPLIEGKE